MRSKGKIATWHDDKGYGFLKPFDGNEQVFIHIKAFANRSRRPRAGEVVTFAVEKDKQGRLRATSASLAGDKPGKAVNRKSSSPAIAIAIFFLLAIAASPLFTELSPLVPIVYVLASTITFIAYALDKSAAKKGRWRTSEGTLHLCALAGGWPGALIAQRTLRHKSSKTSFLIIFWITALINVAAVIWLFTERGQAFLNPIF